MPTSASLKLPLLHLRFNTECTDGLHYWRVLIDEVEHLAAEVRIEVPVFTSRDTLPDGRTKWHISCAYNALHWKDSTLIVR